MRELRGRVAVVTGAGSGIGRGLASVLAQEGMKLCIVDIDGPALSETEAMLRAEGAEVLSAVADVSHPEDMERVAEASFNSFAATHLVCLNAGVVARFAPLWEQRPEEWQWVFGVNTGGVLNGIRAFIPRLAAQRDESHVLITASEAAFSSRPYVGVYHASKHAVIALAETLALELQLAGSKTKVSALCPSGVNTRVLDPRNRPLHLGAPDASETEPGARALELRYRANLATTGAAPEEVARIAVEGIKEGCFYIFPHPTVRDRMLGQTASIVKGVYPEVDPGLLAALGRQA